MGGKERERAKRDRNSYYLTKTTVEHGRARDNVAGCIRSHTRPEVVKTHAESRQREGAETKGTGVGRGSRGLDDGVQRRVHVDVHVEG